MNHYILTFEHIGKTDISTAGGKGANLGEMTQAGIPVPSGAVLSAAAYQLFMEKNKINTAAAPEQIRTDITGGTFPDEIKESILGYYRTLGDKKRVAIRSSATAEDLADASFAGQQETYLNVIGEEMLLNSIKACYASLWNNRAVSYRKTQGYSNTNTALAVVIQQMIESEKSGVLFTSNPAGSKNEILVNASYGLGESVVSGLVSPDEYLCSRGGKILQTIIGSKETQIIYQNTGTCSVPVPKHLRTKQVLTAAELNQLVKKSLEIEQHYNRPMDIEWAFADGNLYILQARSITTLDPSDTAPDFSGLPPVSPIKGRLKASMTFMLEKEPFAYYPLDYDFSMIIGRQKQVILEEGGILIDNECHINDDGMMELPRSGFRLTKNITHFPKLLSDILDHTQNRAAANRNLTKNQEKYSLLKNTDFSALDLNGCKEMFEEIIIMLEAVSYARFRYAVYPGFLMNSKLEKYLKRADKKLTAYNLLSGLSFKTADINRDLGVLAARLSAKSAIAGDILAGKSYQNIVAEYPDTSALFQAFLQKYGCKSDFNCYCFASKSWNEDPDRFLQVLRPMLLSYKNGDAKLLDDGEKNYQNILKKLRTAVGEKKYQQLLPQLESYRFYHWFREESQYLWESLFLLCRKTISRMATILKDDISDISDLYYLFKNELFETCCKGRLSNDAKILIARRKSKRPLAEEYWNRLQWEILKDDGKGLRGVSGSTGEATGKVCIIKSPEEFHKLKKGDILVCHYTDPEWTPLFTLAAAVVSDTGGALSHAAIVAREYGIPAVLGTGTATLQLQDGDTVAVNGTAGKVARLN